MPLSRLLRLAALGLVSALALVAQPRASAAGTESVVTARIRCLAINHEPGELFIRGPENQPQPVLVPASYLAGPYVYIGPASLDFMRRTTPAEKAAHLAAIKPGQPATPPPEYTTAATVALPAAGGDVLVLFESGPNGKHRAAALDYSTLTVPPGTYSVWSLAPRPLGLGLGDTRTLIEPGRRHLVSLPLNSRTYVDLTIYGATPDGRARLLSSGRHAHRPDVRQLMFLTSSPDGSRANIRIITDVTPPASHTVSQNAR